MPWFRMDIHWYEDPKIEEASEVGSGVVFAVFPVLLAKAKAENDGGKVEFTWKKLSIELAFTQKQLRAAVDALASVGVLTCPQASARSAVVQFDKKSWRRWQEAARKAASREGGDSA